MNRSRCLRETVGGARCPACTERLNGRDPDGLCDDDDYGRQPAIQPALCLDCGSEVTGADPYCAECRTSRQWKPWPMAPAPQPAPQPYDADNDALWWMDGESEPAPQPARQPYLCPVCDRPQPDECVCWMYDGSHDGPSASQPVNPPQDPWTPPPSTPTPMPRTFYASLSRDRSAVSTLTGRPWRTIFAFPTRPERDLFVSGSSDRTAILRRVLTRREIAEPRYSVGSAPDWPVADVVDASPPVFSPQSARLAAEISEDIADGQRY
jgi:hypothetical protein